jgi:hypothetical protein
MRKLYLPFIALVTGFANAFIAAGVHSLFFCLAPVLAFIFGYFSSWKNGLLCGFLVFAGYTIATALMWHADINLLYLGQYIYAFILGGFSLPVLGALAPLVRSKIHKIGAVAAIVLLIVVVIWCGYSALPNYSYYYQVIIQSSEDLDDLEIYLPLGHVFGEPYTELYEHPLPYTSGLTEDYTCEIVDTEYGRMLKLTLNGLEWHKSPELHYTGNVVFWQKNVARKLIKLEPRYSTESVDTVTRWRAIGPMKMSESRTIEKFDGPIIIRSAKDADIELRLENRTDHGEAINFAYTKSNTYTELVKFKCSTDNEWQFVPVEVTSQVDIRGIGD